METEAWRSLAADTVILVIESEELLTPSRHLTKVALYLSAMRHFAEEAKAQGFRVDYRRAKNFTDGLTGHRREYASDEVVMIAPRGRRARSVFTTLGVTQLPDEFYLTSVEDMKSRRSRPSRLEQFQREQRRRLHVLMEGEEPCGGRWNFDSENREPLPKDGGRWPSPWQAPLSGDEEALVAELQPRHLGGNALAYWPRTRAQALDQLRDAVERIIPSFGPHEDAASTDNWHLAHSRLSPALNMGLLHPREVITAVEQAFRSDHIGLPSAEGFIRQVLGWREWVWLLHHLRDDSYHAQNYLNAQQPLPVVWRDMGRHEMRCLDAALGHLRDFAWNHHIERLMVLANAATLAGIDPFDVMRWMQEKYADGAEWVMEANVIGMGTFADGGNTATKPYIGGGNYISKMTNFCRGCRFSPTVRVGENACPLTTLYWDFLVRNEVALATVHRIAPQRRAALARPDKDQIRDSAPRAVEVILRGR